MSTYNTNLVNQINELANRYIQGELNVVSELIELTTPYILGHSLIKRASNIFLDASSNAALAILQALNTYKPRKGKFTSWVIYYAYKVFYRQANSEIIRIPEWKRYKNKIGKASYIPVLTFSDLADNINDIEYSEFDPDLCKSCTDGFLDINALSVRYALSKLSEDEQTLIHMIYFERQPVAKIREHFNLSTSKYYTWRKKVLSKLRDLLQEEE